MANVTKDLGLATAYAYYKAGGGTLTEAEFEQKMVDITTAVDDAETAKDDAVAAKNAAEASAQSISQSAQQIATNTADITDLKEDLSAVTALSFSETDGYYTANGVIAAPGAATQEKYTDRFRVMPSDKIKITWDNPTRVGLWVAYGLYDKSGNWMSRTVIGNENNTHFVSEVTIPDNAFYISFCYRTYGTSTTTIEYFPTLYTHFSAHERKSIYDLPWFYSGRPMRLHAHGGLSSRLTDSDLIYNSVPAFEEAGKKQMFVCETDLRKTSDGYYVCSHDDDIGSTTDGTGKISEMTLAQVSALHLLRKNGTVSSLSIPTIDEFLTACKKYNMVAAMELKDATNATHFTNIIEKIKQAGMFNQSYLLHSNVSAMKTIRTLSDIPVVFVAIDSRWTDMYNAAIAFDNIGITYDINGTIDAEKITNCHLNRVPFNVYTVNDKSNADTYFNLGVDMITTDYLTPNDWLT